MATVSIGRERHWALCLDWCQRAIRIFPENIE